MLDVVMSHCNEETDSPEEGENRPYLRKPDTGARCLIRDVREKFAEVSRQTRRDIEAERAFILTKIETVKKDTHMTAEEKKTAIAALKKELP